MIGRVTRLLDAVAYRAFAHQLETDGRAADRTRYRALATDHPYETFLVRQFAIAWTLALSIGSLAGLVGYGLLVDAAPGSDPFGVLASGPTWWLVALAAVLGASVGLVTIWAFNRIVSVTLGALVRRRRASIKRTLPGAVRFLHVVATADAEPRTLVEAVAARKRIHGATATSFGAIQRRAALTGRFEAAIKAVARDTPADSTFAPFLLSFVKQTRQDEAAVRSFLAAESRLLAVEDEHRSRRETRRRQRVIGLFVLMLVGPLVIALGVVWASLLIPGVDAPRTDLFGPVQASVLSVFGTGVIVVLGGTAALFAAVFRPQGRRWAIEKSAQSLGQALGRSGSNPTNALLLTGPFGAIILLVGALAGWGLSETLLAGYLAVALPTGLVDLRRARRRARMDTALPGFVHQLADRLDGGRPLRDAVADIAAAETSGPLQDPVEKLAADLRLLQGPAGGRKRAFERFVGRIGTPLAGRTIGLAIGALEAGADATDAVAHLRTETGRLEHAAHERRGGFPSVLLIGVTVATFVVAVIIAVNGMLLETATPPGPVAGFAVQLGDTEPTTRPELYALTQATMLASGWFAGLTGRGVYEGLLHSGVLLVIGALGFYLAGLL